MANAPWTPVAERHHQVHWFAGRIHEVLDDVTGVCRTESLSPGALPSVSALTSQETAETVKDLVAARDRIDGLLATVLAHAERVDVAEADGATSTQAWLAHATATTHRDARAQVTLAAALERHDNTGVALLGGKLHREQAEVITAAVDRLPSWVADEDRLRAERHLLSDSGTHNAKQLRILGRHVLDVIDPDAADAELAKQLEADERRAARRTHLNLRDNGDGTWSGRFRIPDLHAAMLSKAMHALTSPRRKDPIARESVGEDGAVRERPGCEVFGEAFCDYIERFPSERLTSGGVDATVVVTMSLDSLLGGIQAATLDTGGHISASEARRLACQAGIIPAVLGGKSELLDLGRRRRFHTGGQRIAMALRDRGCTAEHCDRPPGYCHAHHEQPWCQGGHTTVAEGRLLCAPHHTLVHHPGYEAAAIPGGRLRITRRRRT